MTIFGVDFTTKNALKTKIVYLHDELEAMRKTFPFMLGQVVYDVALKNNKGKYTKTKPSLEYSTITEVIVTEKNYFTLVGRLGRNDVFFERKAAEDYLNSICK